MNKQERKAWEALVNECYRLLNIESEEYHKEAMLITAADVHIRRLERQLGEKKVAALLNAKFNKVLTKGN